MCLGIYGGSPQKYLSVVGLEIKIFKANGGARENGMCLKSNKSVRAVALYMGFYAEQISVSVKSAGPIAWSWK